MFGKTHNAPKVLTFVVSNFRAAAIAIWCYTVIFSVWESKLEDEWCPPWPCSDIPYFHFCLCVKSTCSSNKTATTASLPSTDTAHSCVLLFFFLIFCHFKPQFRSLANGSWRYPLEIRSHCRQCAQKVGKTDAGFQSGNWSSPTVKQSYGSVWLNEMLIWFSNQILIHLVLANSLRCTLVFGKTFYIIK